MKTGIHLILIHVLMVNWVNGEDIWPYGTYGLPKTKTGCPDKITWKEGWRKQDLDKKTDTSSNIHMDVQLEGSGNINRRFCIKTVKDTGTEEWPRGFYCIYKAKDSSCPSGMTQGAVQWDDVDILNVNKHGGTLPDGVYDSNTKIYYCCQNMGRWFDPVELPIHRPFYLLPHNNSTVPRCQLAKWAMSLLEYIDYDTVDLTSVDKFYGDHVFLERIRSKSLLLPSSFLRVYYCYYEGCRYKMNENEGVFGPLNGNTKFDKCSWSIEVEKSHVISIEFTQLQLPKCEESYLAVYDGNNEEAVLLEKYCGSKTKKNRIVSSGNQVIMILKSLTPKEAFSSQPKFEVKYNAQRSPGVIPTVRSMSQRNYTSGVIPTVKSRRQRHYTTGFIPSARPTKQSLNTTARNQSSVSKIASIVCLVVIPIVIIIIIIIIVLSRACY